MTWYPSSELLLDPSPLRVSNSVPGQLARSTARELALQRSRAPRPFATRGAGGAGAGIALALASEAWDLFLQQQIPSLEQEYPVDALNTANYIIKGSITFKKMEPVPFDDEMTQNIDTLINGPILAFGVLRKTVTFGDGSTATFHGIGVRLLLPDGSSNIELFGGTNVQNWEIIDVSGLQMSRQDTPTVPIPGGFPANTSPQEGDTPDNDLEFPITLPGGIPGLLLPTTIPIIVPRPADLGERPIPILYPTSLPPEVRRALPQMWLTPTGIQVGRGTQGDPITTTVNDTITNITNITQIQDFRQRIPPPVTTCTPDPEPPGNGCDCDEIREIVIEELDSKFPPARPNSLQTTILATGESGSFVLPSHTQWVELRIVTPPPNVRSQTGGDLAPEVNYNGWYSFGATIDASERIPFHFDFISVKIPAGVFAFSYTVYQGGTAQATVGYLLEE